MPKKVIKQLKLQIPPAKQLPHRWDQPRQAGINIMQFCKEFNEKTPQQAGLIIPVEISVYQDRSFSLCSRRLRRRYPEKSCWY